MAEERRWPSYQTLPRASSSFGSTRFPMGDDGLVAEGWPGPEGFGDVDQPDRSEARRRVASG